MFQARSHSDALDVRIQVTDLPLDNQDHASVGAQTWGSGCLLADMIAQFPAQFGLDPLDIKPIRILELGAGTGLVGLVVAKMLQSCDRQAEVVMSDFHPSVLQNLAENISSNFPSHGPDRPLSISSHFLDWAQSPEVPVPPFDRPFDIIYGADVIYEVEHARWIKKCVETLLRRRPADSSPESSDMYASPRAVMPRFHLVIPLRSTHVAESQSVEQVFPFASVVSPTRQDPFIPVHDTLAVIHKEEVVCEDIVWADGRPDTEYIHYIISWVQTWINQHDQPYP